MILAFPFYMCLTSPIFNIGPPCPLGPSSGGPYITYSPEMV